MMVLCEGGREGGRGGEGGKEGGREGGGREGGREGGGRRYTHAYILQISDLHVCTRTYNMVQCKDLTLS